MAENWTSNGMGVDEQTLGKRLQLARKRSGLTQQELCQKAGLSYSTLAKIERGAIRSPSVFTVASIAEATGTSLEGLLNIKSQGLTPPALSKKRSKTGVRFVYFDVNGVLVRFFHRAFTEVARMSGGQADSIETLFWRHNTDICTGKLSIGEFNDIFAKELGVKDFDWQKHYMKNVEAVPHITELVKWAAENFEIGLFSDSMPGFIDELRRRKLIPEANYTAVADSSKMGSTKAEDQTYKTATELAGVEPNEILLIDDSRSNLTVADRAGWHVLWFDDFRPEESIERVKQSLEF